MNATQGTLSRRTMLAGLAVGSGVAGAAGFAAMRRGIDAAPEAEGSWWSSPAVALERAPATLWLAKIGETFEIDSEAGKLPMRLTRVQPLRSIGERPDEVARQRAFALTFEGEGEQQPAGNRTYSVSHAEGVLDIFFSAIVLEATAPQLVAIFN